MLSISDQLDKAKKEQRELRKEKINAEARVKKLERTLGRTGNRTKSGQIPETESAYQEERDRNEVCVVDYNTTHAVKGLSYNVVLPFSSVTSV